jgi:hypothetical protein
MDGKRIRNVDKEKLRKKVQRHEETKLERKEKG